MALHTCILFLAILGLTAAQVPIPKRKLGYVFGDVKGITPVNVDAFMGPLCPDSKMALPALMQLAAHYGPEVLTLRMHMFPLPYHRNSFLVAMVRPL
jgi:thiol-disulfide isomerase/thioredoxin